jgi:hypothetical protein
MKQRTLRKVMMSLLAALVLWPVGVSAQTVRGDFDYDGDFDISDLTALINYLSCGEWNDQPVGLQRDTIEVKGETIVMVKVDGGILEHDDGWMFRVNDFWICQTEVTRELWGALMGGEVINPGQHFAASQCSWYDCQAFIDTLNACTGRVFRLPNRAEWEFAARGGNLSRGYTYCGGNDIDVVGWYNGNCSKVMPVGLLKCNELGLYDMSGNIGEWCQDAGNSEGTTRYHCGGAFNGGPSSNLPSSQGASNPNMKIGLRLAM